MHQPEINCKSAMCWRTWGQRIKRRARLEGETRRERERDRQTERDFCVLGRNQGPRAQSAVGDVWFLTLSSYITIVLLALSHARLHALSQLLQSLCLSLPLSLSSPSEQDRSTALPLIPIGPSLSVSLFLPTSLPLFDTSPLSRHAPPLPLSLSTLHPP